MVGRTTLRGTKAGIVPRELKWRKRKSWETGNLHWEAGWDGYFLCVRVIGGKFYPNGGSMRHRPMRELEAAKCHAVRAMKKELRKQVVRHTAMLWTLKQELVGKEDF